MADSNSSPRRPSRRRPWTIRTSARTVRRREGARSRGRASLRRPERRLPRRRRRNAGDQGPRPPWSGLLLTLRILLAEDVAMVRGALVALIELEPDLKVVAAVERGDDIVPTALIHQPDIAIIDIDLPGLDGLSAAADLHEQLP